MSKEVNMVRKLLSLILVAVLINAAMVGAAPTHSGAAPEKEAKLIEDVRTMVHTIGIGPQAVVRVKLRNNSKVNGFVSQAGEDAFVVTNAATGGATVVAYSQVRQVQGRNLSTGVKIGIGVGVAVAIAVVLLLLRTMYCNEQAC